MGTPPPLTDPLGKQKLPGPPARAQSAASEAKAKLEAAAQEATAKLAAAVAAKDAKEAALAEVQAELSKVWRGCAVSTEAGMGGLCVLVCVCVCGGGGEGRPGFAGFSGGW